MKKIALLLIIAFLADGIVSAGYSQRVIPFFKLIGWRQYPTYFAIQSFIISALIVILYVYCMKLVYEHYN